MTSSQNNDISAFHVTRRGAAPSAPSEMRYLTDTSAWSIRRRPDGRIEEKHWRDGVLLLSTVHPFGKGPPMNWRKRKKLMRKHEERMAGSLHRAMIEIAQP